MNRFEAISVFPSPPFILSTPAKNTFIPRSERDREQIIALALFRNVVLSKARELRSKIVLRHTDSPFSHSKKMLSFSALWYNNGSAGS